MAFQPLAKTYNSELVITTINGATLFGYARGAGVSIVRVADSWTDTAGNDGEVARSKTNDWRATITIRLMASSLANSILEAFRKADELSGRATFVIGVTDLNSGSYHVGATAWIVRSPDTEYAEEVGVKEWTIRVAALEDAHVGIVPFV